VLRTVLHGAGGAVEIADLFAWEGEGHTPAGRIVRVVTALSGPVEVEVEIEPATSGWSAGAAGAGFLVQTGIPMEAVADRRCFRGHTTLEPGQRLVVTVDDPKDDHHRPLSPDAALDAMEAAALAWRSQLAGLIYDGPYAAAVARSLLVIRALTPSGGGLIAAPTSSLPEQPGGERNWDGRLCRTRDAALAAMVLRAAGLENDADRHRQWLAELIRTADLPIAAVHAVDGGPVAHEEEAPLQGWRRSQPVRYGAAAAAEPDIVGQAALLHAADPQLAWEGTVALADWLAEHWRESELTGDRLAVAAALDRMVGEARRRNPLDLDAVGWQQESRHILAWVEADGIAVGGGLRRDASPADHPDASLLAIAWRGPWPADHPVVERTVDRVLARLGQGPALVERYPPEVDDGLPPGRPPALAASFQAVKALACMHRWEEAHARMETLCSLTGPLGLAGEAADPRSGEALGNIPSAEAHLALIDAALSLADGPG
jgi:GH15 family glucan-1,4-alpha-glucosidase